MRVNHPPIVQISLDLTDIKEAVETAHVAVEAGVDWLEAGTPLRHPARTRMALEAKKQMAVTPQSSRRMIAVVEYNDESQSSTNCSDFP